MKKEICIYDNYDLWNLYKDEAKEMAMETYGDDYTEDSIWECIYLLNDTEYKDTMDELRDFFSNGTYIIFGNIGRWDRIHSGFDIFNDFNDAYMKAVKDCDYIRIYDYDGHFRIECSHHDGTNFYEIKKLTDKGISYFENWDYGYIKNDKRSNDYIMEKLISKYSVLPKFAKKEYGVK